MSFSENPVNRYRLIYPELSNGGRNDTSISTLKPTFTSVLESSKDQSNGQNQAKHSIGAGAEANPIADEHPEPRLLPGRLHPLGVTWLLGWAWDIVLTFIPTCFIGQLPLSSSQRTCQFDPLPTYVSLSFPCTWTNSHYATLGKGSSS